MRLMQPHSIDMSGSIGSDCAAASMPIVGIKFLFYSHFILLFSFILIHLRCGAMLVYLQQLEVGIFRYYAIYNCKAQCNSFFYITKIYKLLYDVQYMVVFVAYIYLAYNFLN